MATRKKLSACLLVVLCLVAVVLTVRRSGGTSWDVRSEMLAVVSDDTRISQDTRSILCNIIGNSENLDRDLFSHLGFQYVVVDAEPVFPWLPFIRRKRPVQVDLIADVFWNSGEQSVGGRRVRVVVFQSAGMTTAATICVLDTSWNVLAWHGIGDPIGEITSVAARRGRDDIVLTIEWGRIYGLQPSTRPRHIRTQYRVTPCEVREVE